LNLANLLAPKKLGVLMNKSTKMIRQFRIPKLIELKLRVIPVRDNWAYGVVQYCVLFKFVTSFEDTNRLKKASWMSCRKTITLR